jgi:Methyltransferase FkbM domain
MSYELIRIGGKGDGGYLIPDDMLGIEECFSPGVSDIAQFECELLSRGIKCYLADYSVDAPPFIHDRIDFEKKFLGAEDDEKFTRLSSWIERKYSGSADLILQMDIEGAEYQILLESPDELLAKFRVIVIEFHHLNRLYEVMGFDLIDLTFRKLLKQFYIGHIHPNNCRMPIDHFGYSVPPVMEFTFVRKDRPPTFEKSTLKYPHQLDSPNVEGTQDVVLPECWRALP